MDNNFNIKIGQEGKAKFYYYESKNKKISSKLPVFYNPKMVVNRDLSNFFIFLNNRNKEDLKKIRNLASLMSASGIREIRWFLELKELGLKKIIANDINKKALELIKKNLKLNNLEDEINRNFIIMEKDARFFDLVLDYIDIDPFGSPLPFLQPLIKTKFFKVTATDLAVLCRFKEKSLAKYKAFAWKKNDLCKIQAVKILTNRIIEFMNMHELNAKPLFFYYYQHHFTIFFEKKRAWTKNYKGLFDEDFLSPLIKGLIDEELNHSFKNSNIIYSKESMKLINILKKEFSFKGYYYYLPKLFSNLKISAIKRDFLINKIEKEGFKASKSHVSPYLIKTELCPKEFLNFLKNT